MLVLVAGSDGNSGGVDHISTLGNARLLDVSHFNDQRKFRSNFRRVFLKRM